MSRLEELRELSDAATPGPWETRVSNIGQHLSPPPTGPIWGTFIACGEKTYHIPTSGNVAPDPTPPAADAAFIVAVVNWVREQLGEGPA